MPIYKTEGKKDMGVSFSNFSDLNSNSDSSLYFVFSQLAQDACQKVHKKANMKISRKVEGENSNPTIFSDDEKENENIFPI